MSATPKSETNENLRPATGVDLPAYKTWLQGLSLRYRQSQIKASVAVNVEMLKFYWSLGAGRRRLDGLTKRAEGESFQQPTQHISKESFAYVPTQNLNESWDDAKLYKKYRLTKEEIAFIKSMLKPME